MARWKGEILEESYQEYLLSKGERRVTHLNSLIFCQQLHQQSGLIRKVGANLWLMSFDRLQLDSHRGHECSTEFQSRAVLVVSKIWHP